MEERKKGYTFVDKRGRSGEPDQSREAGNAPPERGGPSSSARQEQLDVDFSTLVMSFASAAMIHMGKVPDPVTGQINKNPILAKQNIHIITMLREKTRGNLTDDEEKLIENILYELRMSFIESQRG